MHAVVIRVLSSVILLLSASHVYSSQTPDKPLSQKAWNYLVDGATLTVAVGTRQAGIQVTRKSDGAEGKLVQRDEEAYFLSYSTRPIFLEKNKNVGFTMVFNLSSFKADKQEVSKDVFVDLGTKANGKFFYAVPTIFYQWGDYRHGGTYARIGTGLGFGIAEFDGNIILTESPSQDRVNASNSSISLKPALAFILETRWNHWGLSFSAAGPHIENDEYEFQVEDLSFSVGYSFVF